jgi:hypothetical protein
MIHTEMPIQDDHLHSTALYPSSIMTFNVWLSNPYPILHRCKQIEPNPSDMYNTSPTCPWLAKSAPCVLFHHVRPIHLSVTWARLRMPIRCRKVWKSVFESCLVKMSAYMSEVETCWTLKSTHFCVSRTNMYCTSICFVRLVTAAVVFLINLTAAELSQKRWNCIA